MRERKRERERQREREREHELGWGGPGRSYGMKKNIIKIHCMKIFLYGKKMYGLLHARALWDDPGTGGPLSKY